jgi:uncharacterized protein (TIGR00299 family) protein
MTEKAALPAQCHVHLDAVGGVAGDMFVGALLDALPMLKARVFEDLDAVMLDGACRPELREGLSGGLAVLRFGLSPNPASARLPADVGMHEHQLDHHSSSQHSHSEQHEHGTRFIDLVARIEAAHLQAGTAAHAIGILRRLADAESRMHRVPLEEVHFHEVGDWDSLLDVVAAGSIAGALDGWSWSVSNLPRGGGFVQTRHGSLPMPAPATVELLRGFRWRDDSRTGERVTPTGAAILAHLVPDPTMATPDGGCLLSAGMGAGTRDIPGMPNVLRAMIYAPGVHRESDDEVMMVTFDIDDMSGEEIGVAADRLRALAGVLDVSFGIRVGKKGRPLTDFRMLVVPIQLESVIVSCMRETSIIGLRWHRAQRRRLARESGVTLIDGNPLRHKAVERPSGGRTVKVESDDLARTEMLAARRRLQAQVERGEGETL